MRRCFALAFVFVLRFGVPLQGGVAEVPHGAGFGDAWTCTTAPLAGDAGTAKPAASPGLRPKVHVAHAATATATPASISERLGSRPNSICPLRMSLNGDRAIA
jgi:hypothetical protein